MDLVDIDLVLEEGRQLDERKFIQIIDFTKRRLTRNKIRIPITL